MEEKNIKIANDISELSDAACEAGVIGTLIERPDFLSYTEYLQPRYFYNGENQCLFWAIKELYKKGIETIDIYNLETQIESNAGVKNAYGKYNMPDMENTILLFKKVARNTLGEYKELVNRIIELSFRRELFLETKKIEIDCLTQKITGDCFDGNAEQNLNKLSSNTYERLDNLTKKYIVCDEVQTIGEQIDDIYNEIRSRQSDDGIYGVPSKFNSLNEYFTYEPGELVCLCAKMKMGKSFFLLNECVHKLKNGMAVLVVDTEMPTRLWTERLLSHLSHVDIKRIKSGIMEPQERQAVNDAIEWLRDKPLTHIYDTNPKLENLYATCKMLQNKGKLDFLIYDYLKANEADSSKNYNVLGAMTDFLKNKIAGELNLPVLTAAQNNRGNEIGDSMKILRYSSVVIDWGYKTQEEISRDGVQCGNAKARIVVNRLGQQMDITNEMEYLDFIFDGSVATITEAEKHEANGF